MSQILKLSLIKEPFDSIFNGKKKYEFRTAGKWIESRLYDKEGNKREYRFVEFTNGYRSTRPFIQCKYKGFEIIKKGQTFKSNGKEKKFDEKTYAIKIGKITAIRNIGAG